MASIQEFMKPPCELPVIFLTYGIWQRFQLAQRGQMVRSQPRIPLHSPILSSDGGNGIRQTSRDEIGGSPLSPMGQSFAMNMDRLVWIERLERHADC